MEARVRSWSTGLLAVALVVSGFVAVGRVDGVSDMAFYRAVALLAGAVMIVIGAYLRPRRSAIGTSLLLVGAVASIMVGLDSLVLPLLVAVVVVLTLRDQTRSRV